MVVVVVVEFPVFQTFSFVSCPCSEACERTSLFMEAEEPECVVPVLSAMVDNTGDVGSFSIDCIQPRTFEEGNRFSVDFLPVGCVNRIDGEEAIADNGVSPDDRRRTLPPSPSCNGTRFPFSARLEEGVVDVGEGNVPSCVRPGYGLHAEADVEGAEGVGEEEGREGEDENEKEEWAFFWLVGGVGEV